MALRYTLYLYRGESEAALRGAVDQAVAALGGELLWNVTGTSRREDLRSFSRDGTHALCWAPWELDDACRLFDAVSDHWPGPWMVLRVQEGCLWDYDLYLGRTWIDRFSTWAAYWDDGAEEAHIRPPSAHARLLSQHWGVPADRVERYLVNWGEGVEEVDGLTVFRRKGKAYPDDEFEYGDAYQFFDFLRVIGGAEPPAQHTLRL